ncbi:MAG TPA: SRPBCC domain-containing protein [Hyphomonadaceae bacterium]|nr:SRPBCC domain-containing protein [Hyphomonadaceae bacterium]
MTEFTLNNIAIVFITASPHRVWDALTDPEVSAKYFMNSRVTVGPVGGDYIVAANGQVSVSGKVLVREPPRRLRVTWVVPAPSGMKFPNCEVEFLIEAAETTDGSDVTKLTVSEFTNGPVDPKFQRAGRTGWALITSGLKSWLETGAPLPRVKLQPPA